MAAHTGREDSAKEPGIRVSIPRGTAWGIVADAVAAVSGLAVAIVVSRSLGPDGRGVFFLAVLTATLVALVCELGFSASGLVFAANRRIRLSHVHGVGAAVSFIVGGAGGALLLAFQAPLRDTVLQGLSVSELWFVAAGIGPMIYSQVAGSMLVGLGRVPASSLIQIIWATVTPVAMTAAVWFGGTAFWAIVAWLGTVLLLAAMFGFELTRHVGMPTLASGSEIRHMLSFSVRSQIGTLSHQGFLRIDTLFISARSGPADVGQYSLASVLAERISILGTALHTAGAARIGGDAIEESAPLAARMMRVLLIAMVPVAVVAMIAAEPLITLVFGEDFAPAVVPFVILMPGTVCLTLWYVISLYLVAGLQRPGLSTIIQGTGLLLSLPLYYLAVAAWGMTGGALVSTAVYSGVTAAGLWVFVRHTPVRARELVPRRGDVAAVRDFFRAVLRAPFAGRASA